MCIRDRYSDERPKGRRVSLPVLDLAALGVLLVFLPVVAVVQLRFLGDVEIERMPAYVSSIFTLAGLGVLAWLLGTRDGGAAAMVGATSPAAPPSRVPNSHASTPS